MTEGLSQERNAALDRIADALLEVARAIDRARSTTRDDVELADDNDSAT